MDFFRDLRSQYAEALTSGSYIFLLGMAFMGGGKANRLVYFALLANNG